MDKRRGIARNKFASGLLRGAALSGLVTGLVSASLVGVPTASATCIGISGINIGGGCDSTFGNFALVLGTGEASANGFFTAAVGTGNGVSAFSDGLGTLAYAGGSGTQAETAGILNLAVAGLGFEGLLGVGTNVAAFGGHQPLDFLNVAVNIGSADDPLAFDDEGNPVGDAYSWVEASDGGLNLAGNLFGNANSVDGVPTRMVVWSGGDDETLGFGTVAANVFGNRNEVQAIGSFLNATNWGNIIKTPNGSDDTVTAGTIGSPTSASWAFNYQGIFSEACSTALCGNTVNATGPGAIAGAIGVINREVDQDGFGISLATQLNDTGALAVLKPHDGIARDSGSVSHLRGRKLPELPPGRQVLTYAALGTGDRDRCPRDSYDCS